MKSLISLISLLLPLALNPMAFGDTTAFRAEETDATIVLWNGENPVLIYHKTEVDPPAGIDPIFKRSGFIHPVRTPGGSVVTGIHPPDHHHHLGLWHAWVHCIYDGKDVDFWNLATKTGRVRYAETLGLGSESAKASFSVRQEHIAYLAKNAEPKVILDETFTVTLRLVDGAYEIDYETSQKNVAEHTLELPAYRYGGTIAYRAPAGWNKTNSDYLSSEGKTRVNGHETRSRWCAMWGPSDTEGKKATVTILSHGKNHDAPQRMRVWPPSDNNGAIFFNYVPIQEEPWEIRSGATSVMRYRLVVEDSKADTGALNERWQRYNEE
jgi:hypothetical protein